MIKEEFENYVDGQAVDEKELATVVGYCENTVIFQNDDGAIFFLTAELPEAFEIGTVEPIEGLLPILEADEDLQRLIILTLGRS